MANVITVKVIYENCDNRIWREIQVSSNSYLSQLGYAILATFDTMAYHLFSIEYRDTVYSLPDEEGTVPREKCLFCFKLSDLNPRVGDKLKMIYDFGCEQVFSIEITDIFRMANGNGRAYPRIKDGEGFGIIDDVPAEELLEIIHEIDRTGIPTFLYEAKYPSGVPWDYRRFELNLANALFKYDAKVCSEGYDSLKEYIE